MGVSVVADSVLGMATSPDASTLTVDGVFERAGEGAVEGVGRPVLGGAAVALGALTGAGSGRVWALRDDEVAAAVGVLGEVVAAARAQLVVVLAEAQRRSLGAGQGWGAVDWARAAAPSLSTRDLLDAHEVATAVAAGAVSAHGGDHRLDELVDAVADAASPSAQDRAGGVGVGKAALVCRFHRSARGLADPGVLGEVTATLVDAARGPAGLEERQLAAAVRHAGQLLRPDRVVEHDAAVRRAHRSLVKGRGPVGMWRYTLVLDDEGAAIVDAAVDALAKPARDADTSTGTGERDPRTPAARRADALLDLVTRAVGAPEGVPRQAKTALVVTIPLQVLEGRCRGAGPRSGTCGCATAAGARSPAAPDPRAGPTRTTWSTGPTAAPPASTTPPCSAAPTTASSTPTATAHGSPTTTTATTARTAGTATEVAPGPAGPGSSGT